MSTPVTFNGSTYNVPAVREARAWGQSLSNYLVAISTGCLQKTGGLFTLTAEANFGATYGLLAQYYKSGGTNIATSGILRMANAEYIQWRNAANSANLGLRVNSSNVLEFNGAPIVNLALGTGDYVLTMNAGGTAFQWSQLVNANISASAAIAYSKLAALTASRALVSDVSGFVSASSVTGTELGYLSGVTSAIQTQLGLKAPLASPTFSGTITTPLTASRAVVTGASSELAASAATATEVGYLSGVTSAIQTQIGTKVTSGGALGTPSSGTLTNCTGLPVSTGISGLGTNVAAFLATPSSANLLAALTTSTGTGSAVFGTSPDFTTSIRLLAQGEIRFADSDSSNYVGFKSAATVSANKIWTLPDADGSANQVLKTDGALGLGWATVATDSTAQYGVKVGDSGGTAQQSLTNLLGRAQAEYSSATVTISNATPGVVSHTSHGRVTGDRVYFTTTGGLPTGLSVSTSYWITKIDANSYKLSSSLANCVAGTYIATSSAGSGVHTAYYGGIGTSEFRQGSLTGTAPASGEIGEVKYAESTAGVGAANGSYVDITSITITRGIWLVSAQLIWNRTSATMTTLNVQGGVSTSSASGTGLVDGRNTISAVTYPTSVDTITLALPGMYAIHDGTTITLNGTALAAGSTLYLKMFESGISTGTPKGYGYLCAVRVA